MSNWLKQCTVPKFFMLPHCSKEHEQYSPPANSIFGIMNPSLYFYASTHQICSRGKDFLTCTPSEDFVFIWDLSLAPPYGQPNPPCIVTIWALPLTNLFQIQGQSYPMCTLHTKTTITPITCSIPNPFVSADSNALNGILTMASQTSHSKLF